MDPSRPSSRVAVIDQDHWPDSRVETVLKHKGAAQKKVAPIAARSVLLVNIGG